MDQDKFLEDFNLMQETLVEVQDFHAEKQEAYDGDRFAKVLAVTKNAKIQEIISKQSSWGKVGVDTLLRDVSFDAFENDTFGLTKLLVDVNADAHIESAQKNSMIGACAFVAIFPREDELPVLATYTGSQATGIKELHGDELKYGLAEKVVDEDGEVLEYFFFEKGWIHVVDADGEVLESVELETETMALVEFNYGLDVANKPHGSSRLSSTSLSAMDSALNSEALMQQAGIVNTLKSDIIVVSGSPDSISSSAIEGNIDSYSILFNDSGDAGSVDVKRSAETSVTSHEKLYNISGNAFATAMGFDPSVLGLESASGSYSSDALSHMNKNYETTVNSARRNYSKSILELAIKVYEIASGSDENDFTGITVAFNEVFDISRVGALGDALQKLETAGIDLPVEFINKKLGVPLRQQALAQGYADFNLSRFTAGKFDALRESINEEINNYTLPDVRRISRGSDS